jgi:hypothetical protein
MAKPPNSATAAAAPNQNRQTSLDPAQRNYAKLVQDLQHDLSRGIRLPAAVGELHYPTFAAISAPSVMFMESSATPDLSVPYDLSRCVLCCLDPEIVKAYSVSSIASRLKYVGPQFTPLVLSKMKAQDAEEFEAAATFTRFDQQLRVCWNQARGKAAVIGLSTFGALLLALPAPIRGIIRLGASAVGAAAMFAASRAKAIEHCQNGYLRTQRTPLATEIRHMAVLNGKFEQAEFAHSISALTRFPAFVYDELVPWCNIRSVPRTSIFQLPTDGSSVQRPDDHIYLMLKPAFVRTLHESMYTPASFDPFSLSPCNNNKR